MLKIKNVSSPIIVCKNRICQITDFTVFLVCIIFKRIKFSIQLFLYFEIYCCFPVIGPDCPISVTVNDNHRVMIYNDFTVIVGSEKIKKFENINQILQEENNNISGRFIKSSSKQEKQKRKGTSKLKDTLCDYFKEISGHF